MPKIDAYELEVLSAFEEGALRLLHKYVTGRLGILRTAPTDAGSGAVTAVDLPLTGVKLPLTAEGRIAWSVNRRRRKERLNLGEENREVLLHDGPDQGMVDVAVFVNQHIPLPYHLAPWNFRMGFLKLWADSVRRFANDLYGSLDGILHHQIHLVLVEGLFPVQTPSPGEPLR
jgi:hypothetical protein